jgi:hypothetical protein
MRRDAGNKDGAMREYPMMEPGLFLEVSIKIFYLLSDCQFILKNK